MLDAIFYVLSAVCPWRFSPDSFPPWCTVYAPANWPLTEMSGIGGVPEPATWAMLIASTDDSAGIMNHGGYWATAIAQQDIMHRVADGRQPHGLRALNIEYRSIDRSIDRGIDRGGGIGQIYVDVWTKLRRLAKRRRCG